MAEKLSVTRQLSRQKTAKRQAIPFFEYRDGALHCEDVPVSRIAEKVGTPAYVYSASSVLGSYRSLASAFGAAKPIICFSVKANANLGLLKLMAREGAGFDVVSGGEIFRALKAGGDPRKIVYAGVGKTDDEIAYALRAGILMFNVESEPELENINAIAGKMGVTASVALRLNPDVDPRTHVYITTGKKENKFGIDVERAARIVTDLLPRLGNCRLAGLHMHIGSQITQVGPHAKALARVVRFIQTHRSQLPDLQYLNIGGGFGILYDLEKPAAARDVAAKLLPLILKTGLRLVMEPGRFIVGNAGILLTRVLYVKLSGAEKRFLICDAAMNDLVRPTLYDAYHRIWPAETAVSLYAPSRNGLELVDVVGPICESGDFLAKDRWLPPARRGDLLAIFSAGAYGHTMSSNYNARPRACEVLVQGDRFTVVRRRETNDDLIVAETNL